MSDGMVGSDDPEVHRAVGRLLSHISEVDSDV